MFDSVGWSEIFFILIIGLIVIGPERLPGVIQDVRAAIFAARKAINNAKKELNGEFDDFSADLAEFQKPISQITSIRAMGPKAALGKVLFDDDPEVMDMLDPKTKPTDQPTTPTPTDNQPSGGGPKNRSFNWDDVT